MRWPFVVLLASCLVDDPVPVPPPTAAPVEAAPPAPTVEPRPLPPCVPPCAGESTDWVCCRGRDEHEPLCVDGHLTCSDGERTAERGGCM